MRKPAGAGAIKVVIMPETMPPLCLDGLPPAPVSRLAPTPSGFLHLGNAVNFLVTWAIVRSLGGTLFLRIDDMDGIRFRKEVLEDIFVSLDWLGLDWDKGPWGPDDFYQNYSLQLKKETYRHHLNILTEKSRKPFACQCSRRTIKKKSANGLYPGTCRDKRLPFKPFSHAIRLKVDPDTRILINRQPIDLAREFGDFVIWRKDDQPSYQLASLLEDEAANVNLIIRGEDLLLSTAAQLYLAGCYNFSSFPACCFRHHGLILGKDGEKLSKSRGAYALKDIREAKGRPAQAVKAAAPLLGLDPQSVFTANDLKTHLAKTLKKPQTP